MRILILSFIILFNIQGQAGADYKPIPFVKDIRVVTSEPRKIVWADLSSKEQKLAKHLLRAAVAGVDIIYYQNHRHGILIRDMLKASLDTKNLPKTKEFLGSAFNEYLNYAAKFTDQKGPYAPSNRKYILNQVKADQISELFKRHGGRTNPLAVEESVRLMTDPSFEVISLPENPDGTDLEISGGNLYEHGLKAAEVMEAFKNGLDSDLNCRIQRDPKGKIVCERQALNNPRLSAVVRRALTVVVKELKKAIPYACTELQSEQLKHLVKFLQQGKVEDFRQMNIAWVKDGTSSKVDFMMGYVETYQDFHNQIGSWESYVQIIDPKTTALSVALAKNAQGFEDQMPYGQFRKTFPENYSPPALMVYYFQELSGFHSGGYNLPNFDDIRRDVGAKNIIRLDLPGLEKDPVSLNVRREIFQEFLTPDRVELVLNDWPLIRKALVLLHEVIGHGSGTYDESKYGPKEDPIGALGQLGGALEEQRADQAALVFVGDPILVKIGLYKDQQEALRVRNTMYDGYLATFLQIVSKQRSLSEAHTRGHWILINKLFEKGAIEKVSRDGSTLADENLVLRVKDYNLFHQVSVELLAELQRIKAVRDEASLKEIFEKYAPLTAINEPWLQAIIKRGEKLLANAGSIEQPWDLHKKEIRVFGGDTLESIAPFLME